MINGYIAALATPFNESREIDFASFEKYIAFLCDKGISGVVVCGSTGESLSLSLDEKIILMRFAREIVPANVTLIGGVIESCTNNGIALMRKVEQYVDEFLCICPYYVKPTQEQLIHHFAEYSHATGRNIIVYNNPGRTAVDLQRNTLDAIMAMPNIIAIKECSSDLSRFFDMNTDNNFSFLSGNDDTAHIALLLGAHGVISVSANVAPELCNKLFTAIQNKNVQEIRKINQDLQPLHSLMFKEPSPAPLKYALNKIGLIQNVLRDPLTSISKDLAEKIDAVLMHLGIYS